MSSSYGEQWLGTEESFIRRRSSLNTTTTPDLNHHRSKQKQQQQRAIRRPSTEKPRHETIKRVLKQPTIPGPTSTTKSFLNHLEVSKKPDTEKHKDLHPAVLTLGLLFSTHQIVGSNARCLAVLETLAQVIRDHRPPPHATFVRDIQKHLEPHIDYLLSVRTFSLSIREIIRYVKKAVSDLVALDPALSDQEAKEKLTKAIQHFIRARITAADQLIVQYGLLKIEDGDRVLTYAKSSVVQSLLLKAKQAGKDFSVVIVDSRPLLEGEKCVLYS